MSFSVPHRRGMKDIDEICRSLFAAAQILEPIVWWRLFLAILFPLGDKPSLVL